MDAISKQLSVADVFCFLIPILRPYLLCDIVQVTESNLLQALQSSVRILIPRFVVPLAPSDPSVLWLPAIGQVSRENFDKALYSIGPLCEKESENSPENPPDEMIDGPEANSNTLGLSWGDSTPNSSSEGSLFTYA